MDEPLAKQLPDGSWAPIAKVLDDGTIAPITVGDCCCDDDPDPKDWPCDEPPPPCLLVTLSGFTSSGCVVDDFCLVEESVALSVEGINGTYVVREDEFYSRVGLFCIIRAVGISSGTVRVAHQSFGLSTGVNCSYPGAEEWQVNTGFVSTGSPDICQPIPLYGANIPDFAVPFGTPMESSFTVDCGVDAFNGLVIPGTMTVTPLENCPEPLPNTYYATLCGDDSVRITVDVDTRPDDHFWVYYGDDRYAITGEWSNEAPVPVSWTMEPCAEPQADHYIALPCDPRFPIVAYQLSPGMQPGEGIIWDVVSTPSANFPDCVQSRKYRCTDQAAPPELRLASESQRAGACGQGIDFAQRDCTNIGDDDPVPQTPRGRGLGDITARAINIATLGRVKPCSACKRRQAALNRIRLGKREGP